MYTYIYIQYVLCSFGSMLHFDLYFVSTVGIVVLLTTEGLHIPRQMKDILHWEARETQPTPDFMSKRERDSEQERGRKGETDVCWVL